MPIPSRFARQLDRLVGRWRTTGTMLAGPDAGHAFSGSDVYRWLPGSTFLEHTWRVGMPDGPHRGVEIFGLAADRRSLFAHAYDADGSFTGSSIVFRGRTLLIHGPELSFRGRFSADGDAMTGQWSTTADASPVMTVNVVRRFTA